VLRSPEHWAIRLLFFGQFFDLLLRPLAWLLILIQGQPPTDQNPLGSITEDDFRNWVEDGQPSGSLEKGERKMIYSIIQFRETLCREVMVPRIDVLALDVNTPLSEAILALTHSGHSRVPVYEETIDNIVGVLYAKDLLRVKTPEVSPSTLRGLFRPAYFVPEAKKVDELLTEMQARGVHIAIVVDEYGGMAGLVTLEDIVEEIVGEIRDEYDQTEELPFQKIGDEEYLFSGRISLDDFNELLDTHLATDIADTLGGFIYGEIGRVPVGGEQVEVEGWTLVVDQVIGRRIRKIKALHKPGLVEVEEKKNDSEH
jgi:putative hemolysin